ncbi:hypothetical protein [Bifidobacterium bombi]|uniref:PhnA protein n=1 Tax=Bifidobacterium bombi DSM 19703 TaxID=1341695 RepID=A0A080N3P3_9BIFI|nr:hypothetical protein [Bifidobacterium bombi]KFF31661.1 hypothetical protein BBOMB_1048 [Bifidobacterium bombi DSM 19703]
MMVDESRSCGNCGNPVSEPWRLCQACRKDYARQIHRLRLNMQQLHALAMREYKLSGHEVGAHGHGTAPTPVNIAAWDLEVEAEAAISSIAATVQVWGDWHHILRRLTTVLPRLCQSPYAVDDYRDLVRLNERIGRRVERRKVKPFAGRCPNCGREVEADKDEHGMVCQCGHWVNLDSLRADTRERWQQLHTTQTPAGAAKWVSRQTGVRVTRQDVKNWLHRGKVHASQLEGGYYEFPIGELVTQANRKSQ